MEESKKLSYQEKVKLLLDKLDCRYLKEYLTEPRKKKQARLVLRFENTTQGAVEAGLVTAQLRVVNATFSCLSIGSRQIVITNLPESLNAIQKVSATFDEFTKKTQTWCLSDRQQARLTAFYQAKLDEGIDYGGSQVRSLDDKFWEQLKCNKELTERLHELYDTILRMEFMLRHTTQHGDLVIKNGAIMSPRSQSNQNKGMAQGFTSFTTGVNDEITELRGKLHEKHAYVYFALKPKVARQVSRLTSNFDAHQFVFDYKLVKKYREILLRPADPYLCRRNAVESPTLVGKNIIRLVAFERGGGQGRKCYTYQNLETGKKRRIVVRVVDENTNHDALQHLGAMLVKELIVMAELDQNCIYDFLADMDEEKAAKIFGQFFPLVEVLVVDNVPLKVNGESLLVEHFEPNRQAAKQLFNAIETYDLTSIRRILKSHQYFIEDTTENNFAPILAVLRQDKMLSKQKKAILNVFYDEFRADVNQFFVFYEVKVRGIGRPISKRYTAFMFAAFSGDLVMMRYLQSKGANIHAQDPKVNRWPENALTIAERRGHWRVCNYLSKQGVQIFPNRLDFTLMGLKPLSKEAMVENIRALSQVICASQHMGVKFKPGHKQPDSLIFRCNSSLVSEDLTKSVHKAQLPLMHFILGSHCFANINSMRLGVMLAQNLQLAFRVSLNNKQYKVLDGYSLPGDHDAFVNCKAVLERLFAFEFTTALANIQDLFRLEGTGKRHPLTGAGSANSQVLYLPQRLVGFKLSATVTDQNTLRLKVKNTNENDHSGLALTYLLRVFPELSGKIKRKEATIYIDMPIEDIVAYLKQKRVNWTAAIVVGDKGRLAGGTRRIITDKGKFEIGDTFAGGFNPHPYCPLAGAIQGAEDEFHLFVKPENYQLVIKLKQYNDLCVYLIDEECWSFTQKAGVNNKSGNFSPCESEFSPNSGRFGYLTEKCWRGLQRDEVGLDCYIEYEKELIFAAFAKLGAQPLGIEFNSDYTDYHLKELPNVSIRKADSNFGNFKIWFNRSDNEKINKILSQVKFFYVISKDKNLCCLEFVSLRKGITQIPLRQIARQLTELAKSNFQQARKQIPERERPMFIKEEDVGLNSVRSGRPVTYDMRYYYEPIVLALSRSITKLGILCVRGDYDALLQFIAKMRPFTHFPEVNVDIGNLVYLLTLQAYLGLGEEDVESAFLSATLVGLFRPTGEACQAEKSIRFAKCIIDNMPSWTVRKHLPKILVFIIVQHIKTISPATVELLLNEGASQIVDGVSLYLKVKKVGRSDLCKVIPVPKSEVEASLGPQYMKNRGAKMQWQVEEGEFGFNAVLASHKFPKGNLAWYKDKFKGMECEFRKVEDKFQLVIKHIDPKSFGYRKPVSVVEVESEKIVGFAA